MASVPEIASIDLDSTQDNAIKPSLAAPALPGGATRWIFMNRKWLVALVAVITLPLMLLENDLWITHFPVLWEVQVVFAWLLVLGGAGIRQWSIIHIGGSKSETVVDTGPYAINRNPLYTGSFLCLVGVCILSGCLVSSLFCISAVAIIYGATVRFEELRLALAFGPAYQDYMRRVPRFLPRLWASDHSVTVSVPSRDVPWSETLWNVRRELRTTGGFVAAALVVWMIEYLNHEGHEYGILPSLIDVSNIQLGMGLL